MATAGSYAPTPDSSTRSGAQYIKEGASQAPYGIDIPPTPVDEPSYSPHKADRMFEDDKSGARSMRSILVTWNFTLFPFFPVCPFAPPHLPPPNPPCLGGITFEGQLTVNGAWK
ncbi:hypothetical protein KFL_002460170 [Klebsormidium nitens]|uniref:Uncharacterized protein n=1 Tax=Klebsormidium nitens TaxID=105231 RepID=A0A1Y1I6S7_KLENI|nr:hypothetical protein KFL_002460170 [Klebsormidium nitens]|eukprot:GAQ85642.1 hypothetical protein KFL_002460170 [Klebsormidium nitens]